MLWPGFLVSPLKMFSPRPDDGAGLSGGPSHTIRLDALAVGQCGLIHDLDMGNNDDKHLRSLGICPGRRVWMVRRGDPMVLRVMGTRLGLAAELANKVTVEVCASACPVDAAGPAMDASKGAHL